MPATQRGYTLDEMKANTALKVDIDYYLAQQVHPVVSRLIECLEGTDAVRVAECLGKQLLETLICLNRIQACRVTSKSSVSALFPKSLAQAQIVLSKAIGKVKFLG